MIGSILKIGAALAGLAQDAFAYFRKKDDQNTGRKLQAGDDNTVSLKDAQDARKDETRVDSLTHDQLVDELRNPAGSNS